MVPLICFILRVYFSTAFPLLIPFYRWLSSLRWKPRKRGWQQSTPRSLPKELPFCAKSTCYPLCQHHLHTRLWICFIRKCARLRTRIQGDEWQVYRQPSVHSQEVELPNTRRQRPCPTQEAPREISCEAGTQSGCWRTRRNKDDKTRCATAAAIAKSVNTAATATASHGKSTIWLLTEAKKEQDDFLQIYLKHSTSHKQHIILFI